MQETKTCRNEKRKWRRPAYIMSQNTRWKKVREKLAWNPIDDKSEEYSPDALL